jgi:hypothetical protein
MVCISFDRSHEIWKAKIGFRFDAYEMIFNFLFAPEEFELLHVAFQDIAQGFVIDLISLSHLS